MICHLEGMHKESMTSLQEVLQGTVIAMNMSMLTWPTRRDARHNSIFDSVMPSSISTDAA